RTRLSRGRATCRERRMLRGRSRDRDGGRAALRKLLNNRSCRVNNRRGRWERVALAWRPGLTGPKHLHLDVAVGADGRRNSEFTHHAGEGNEIRAIGLHDSSHLKVRATNTGDAVGRLDMINGVR